MIAIVTKQLSISKLCFALQNRSSARTSLYGHIKKQDYVLRYLLVISSYCYFVSLHTFNFMYFHFTVDQIHFCIERLIRSTLNGKYFILFVNHVHFTFCLIWKNVESFIALTFSSRPIVFSHRLSLILFFFPISPSPSHGESLDVFDHLQVYREMGFKLHVKITSTLRDTIDTCILNFPSSSSVIDVSNALVIYRSERVNNHFSSIISKVFLHLTQQYPDIVHHFPHISSQSYFFAIWLVQSLMTLRRV